MAGIKCWMQDDSSINPPETNMTLPTTPGIKTNWVFQTNPHFKYCHMAMVEVLVDGTIVAAFQAAAERERDPNQQLFFTRSFNGGLNWETPRSVMFGLLPIWGPLLHKDKDGRLWLFYSESRKTNYPGGDIKYITTMDRGETWTPPVMIYTFEHRQGVAKVTANKLVDLGYGVWLLPTWTEPHRSFEVQHRCSFVLKTEDYGRTWRDHGDICYPPSWLIEPTLAPLSNPGHVIMYFRTAMGHLYQSISNDYGETWSAATESALLNPNSKAFLMPRQHPDGSWSLTMFFNNSTKNRWPLTIAQSKDDAATWQHVVDIETTPNMMFAYPTAVQLSPTRLLVLYTVYDTPGRSPPATLAQSGSAPVTNGSQVAGQTVLSLGRRGMEQVTVDGYVADVQDSQVSIANGELGMTPSTESSIGDGEEGDTPGTLGTYTPPHFYGIRAAILDLP
eukprot:jgi/Mesvir1/12585/Mv10333-RA.1